MNNKINRFGVSIPDDLLRDFDSLIKEKGYQNRSEAIRDLIRKSIVEEHLSDENQTAFGSLTIIYDHHKGNVQDSLTKIQHKYFKEIISNIHIHIDHDNCLEVLLLKGSGKNIREIAHKITSLKGVKQGKLALSAL